MDALQQLPTHGDGIFDMRGLVRTLLETMASEIMDAQVGMACEDGATTCNGYRERGLAAPVGASCSSSPCCARGRISRRCV